MNLLTSILRCGKSQHWGPDGLEVSGKSAGLIGLARLIISGWGWLCCRYLSSSCLSSISGIPIEPHTLADQRPPGKMAGEVSPCWGTQVHETHSPESNSSFRYIPGWGIQFNRKQGVWLVEWCFSQLAREIIAGKRTGELRT